MPATTLHARMYEAFRSRMLVFLGLVALVFGVFLIQLVNLQIVQGESYKQKSRQNMENNIPIAAPRGEIYDRNFGPERKGVVIASSRAAFNISTIPASFKSPQEMRDSLKPLCALLKVSYDDLMNEIKGKNPYERVTIKEDTTLDTVITIASHQHRFPHVDWQDAPIRVYNYGSIFSHVLGYIGSISPDEYKRLKESGYRHYQKIGKSGLEREYDAELRGLDGYYRRIVDVRNRMEGEEIGLQPVSGSNLVLTIDFDVQKAAYEGMKDIKGGAVVIKPATGEVLALVSQPDFNPNQIISKNNSKVLDELSKDENRPFLNRVIQSKYPPASTFKLLTSIATLEEDKWNPEQTYHCPGKYTLKGYIDRDFYCYEAHGTLDMYWAIAKSCSVYFYQLGYKIGPSAMIRYAEYFGLQDKTGIDLPGEIPGFLPSKKWKLKTFGQQWFDGDTINMAIGQGFVNVTPIEMADLVCGIVNNGVIMKPYIVKEMVSPDNKKVIRRTKPEMIREIPLSPTTVATLKQGMRLSVRNGTSQQLAYLPTAVAGKTGTAQTRSQRREDASQHAWFVGFAPFNGEIEDTVAVAILVEYGVTGAAAAVPVAEKIFATLQKQGYFNAQQKRDL
ncbi:MAG: penicillin-binding protein 2 [Spirochaetes bacterium]|nr:MAG: penicillin-binding protein 2 [Spirochaetota bacterium]